MGHKQFSSPVSLQENRHDCSPLDYSVLRIHLLHQKYQSNPQCLTMTMATMPPSQTPFMIPPLMSITLLAPPLPTHSAPKTVPPFSNLLTQSSSMSPLPNTNLSPSPSHRTLLSCSFFSPMFLKLAALVMWFRYMFTHSLVSLLINFSLNFRCFTWLQCSIHLQTTTINVTIMVY